MARRKQARLTATDGLARSFNGGGVWYTEAYAAPGRLALSGRRNGGSRGKSRALIYEMPLLRIYRVARDGFARSGRLHSSPPSLRTLPPALQHRRACRAA